MKRVSKTSKTDFFGFFPCLFRLAKIFDPKIATFSLLRVSRLVHKCLYGHHSSLRHLLVLFLLSNSPSRRAASRTVQVLDTHPRHPYRTHLGPRGSLLKYLLSLP